MNTAPLAPAKDAPLFAAQPVLLHGGDWNPDQWLDQPEISERDFALMAQSGCNTFSVGIFAWSALESADGQFTMDWLQQILDRMHRQGLKALLATPSGSKPIWLARRHPEICRVDGSGHRDLPRGRHNHCPSSPAYRRAVERINAEIARRFGQHPAVAGWHIGNEFGGKCWCELCLANFRLWLQKRHGTLETLNQAVWSNFWAHRFSSWEDVIPQDPNLDGIGLEWRRFSSEQLINFIRFEIEVLRCHGARQPMTTNLMGFYPELNSRELAAHVDLIADDTYPEYHGGPEQITTAVRVSLVHDLMRSLKMRSYLQMECSPTVTNWQRLSRLKRVGMHRLEMLQTLAHGADGTMYFQWRAGRGAHEKWHGAVVDHSGTDQTRVFQEVQAHSQLLGRLDGLQGARSHNQVAVLWDLDTRWALESSCLPHGIGPDRGYEAVLLQCARPLWERGIGLDLRSRTDDLTGYRLVVIPQGYQVTEDDAARLKRYIAGGGVVLATWLFGRVGAINLCHLGGFPGPGLRELFGVWVEELDQTGPSDTITVQMADGTTWPVTGLIDRARLEGAEALAQLHGDPLHEGGPALSRHRYGNGQAWYWMAQPGSLEGADAVLGLVLAELGIQGRITTIQRGFTVQARTDGQREWLFALNFHDRQPANWPVPAGCRCVESGTEVTGILSVPPQGSRVLVRTRP